MKRLIPLCYLLIVGCMAPNKRVPENPTPANTPTVIRPMKLGNWKVETQVFVDKSGKWRWRCQRNGQNIAISVQGYKAKEEAEKSWQEFVNGAVIEAYRNSVDEWRWRAKSGKVIVAKSPGGYQSAEQATNLVSALPLIFK